MRSTDLHKLLDRYLDGTLSPEERNGFEEHLAHCAACRREIEIARCIESDMKSLPQLREPEGFLFRFRARLAREEEKNNSRWSFLASPFMKGIAAVTLAVPVLIFFLVREPFHEKKILVSDEARPLVEEKAPPAKDALPTRPRAAAVRKDQVRPEAPAGEKMKTMAKKSGKPADKVADDLFVEPVYRLTVQHRETSRSLSEQDTLREESPRLSSRKEAIPARDRESASVMKTDDSRKIERSESDTVTAALKRFGATDISIEEKSASILFRYRINPASQSELENELSRTHSLERMPVAGIKKLITVELILKKREP